MPPKTLFKPSQQEIQQRKQAFDAILRAISADVDLKNSTEVETFVSLHSRNRITEFSKIPG